jgi:hypothetical protein
MRCAACGCTFEKGSGNYAVHNLFGTLFYVCPKCYAKNLQRLIGGAVEKWLESPKYRQQHPEQFKDKK